MKPLPDPDQCPRCRSGKFRVFESKKRKAGYRRRMCRCKNEKCGHEWPVYLSVVKPLPEDIERLDAHTMA